MKGTKPGAHRRRVGRSCSAVKSTRARDRPRLELLHHGVAVAPLHRDPEEVAQPHVDAVVRLVRHLHPAELEGNAHRPMEFAGGRHLCVVSARTRSRDFLARVMERRRRRMLLRHSRPRQNGESTQSASSRGAGPTKRGSPRGPGSRSRTRSPCRSTARSAPTPRSSRPLVGSQHTPAARDARRRTSRNPIQSRTFSCRRRQKTSRRKDARARSKEAVGDGRKPSLATPELGRLGQSHRSDASRRTRTNGGDDETPGRTEESQRERCVLATAGPASPPTPPFPHRPYRGGPPSSPARETGGRARRWCRRW